MKRIFTAAILLILLLNACAPTQPAATAIATPTTRLMQTATATLEPSPTLSPVDLLLEAYLTGQSVDVSPLSPAEFKEFSFKLAERKNIERGINPVIYNDEAYIHPDHFKMMEYDGYPDQSETIKMYLAIAGKDDQGDLQVFDQYGQKITINNSAAVEWGLNGIISSPGDPRLDWPILQPGKSGYTTVEYPLANKSDYPEILYPAILLNKNLGEVYLGGQQPRKQAALQFYAVETDSMGNPILMKLIMVMPGPIFRLYEEGTSENTETHSGGVIEDYSNFYKTLGENSVYYLSVAIKQDEVYSTYMRVDHEGYQGAVFGNDAFSILTQQSKNDRDLLMITAINMIKTSEK